MKPSDFKTTVILLYFKSVGDQYQLSDIMEFLGTGGKQFSAILNLLIQENFLLLNNNVICLTGAGEVFLSEIGLGEASFFDLLKNPIEQDSIKEGNALTINDVYIPEKFDEKFRGYNKQGESPLDLDYES